MATIKYKDGTVVNLSSPGTYTDTGTTGAVKTGPLSVALPSAKASPVYTPPTAKPASKSAEERAAFAAQPVSPAKTKDTSYEPPRVIKASSDYLKVPFSSKGAEERGEALELASQLTQRGEARRKESVDLAKNAPSLAGSAALDAVGNIVRAAPSTVATSYDYGVASKAREEALQFDTADLFAKQKEEAKKLARTAQELDIFKGTEIRSWIDENQKYVENLDDPTNRFIGQALQGTGAMIPMILTAAVGGPVGGYTVFATQVFGSSFKEALESGADISDASNYAFGQTLLEIGTETLAGGIPGLGKGVVSRLAGLPAAKQLTTRIGLMNTGKFIGHIGKAVATLANKPVGKRMMSAFGEGFEEAISEIVSPFIERATINPDAPLATWKDVAYATALGATISGFLQIGPAVLQEPAARKNLISDAAKEANDLNSRIAADKRLEPLIVTNATSLEEVQDFVGKVQGALIDITQETILNTPLQTSEYNNQNEMDAAIQLKADAEEKLLVAYGTLDLTPEQIEEAKTTLGVDMSGIEKEYKAAERAAKMTPKKRLGDQVARGVAEKYQEKGVVERYIHQKRQAETRNESKFYVDNRLQSKSEIKEAFKKFRPDATEEDFESFFITVQNENRNNPDVEAFAESANEVLSAYGVTVEISYDLGDENATYSADQRVITLNGMRLRSKGVAAQVTAHELVHHAISKDPALMTELKVSMKLLGYDLETEVAALRSTYESKVGAQENAYFEEEALADFVGRVIGDGQLLQTLAQRRPGAVAKIREVLEGMLRGKRHRLDVKYKKDLIRRLTVALEGGLPETTVPQSTDVGDLETQGAELAADNLDTDYDLQYNTREEIEALISKYYEKGDPDAQALAAEALEGLSRTAGKVDRFRLRKGTSTDRREYTGQGRLLGKAFADDLIDTGRVNLLGFDVKDPAELALLSQVYRDPRFETMRIFFMRGNTVVGQQAVSSRLPSSSKIFVETDGLMWQDHIRSRIKRLGADGYYILHNHPSGVPTPSKNDITTTGYIINALGNLANFQGHVVINSTQYSVIRRGTNSGTLTTTTDALPALGKDLLLEPSLPNPLLGQPIKNGVDLASLAKGVSVDDENYRMVVFTGAKLNVNALLEVDTRFLEKSPAEFTNFIRKRAREYGGQHIFYIGELTPNILNMVQAGLFTDAVDPQLPDVASRNVIAGRPWFENLKPGVYAGRTPIPNKSAIDPGSTSALFSLDPNSAVPAFYSQLQRVVESKIQNNMTPEQVMKTLRNGAVREDEIKWSGLAGYLEGKSKVDKNGLLDFLRANEMILEMELQGAVLDPAQTRESTDEIQRLRDDLRAQLEVAFQGSEHKIPRVEQNTRLEWDELSAAVNSRMLELHSRPMRKVSKAEVEFAQSAPEHPLYDNGESPTDNATRLLEAHRRNPNSVSADIVTAAQRVIAADKEYFEATKSPQWIATSEAYGILHTLRSAELPPAKGRLEYRQYRPFRGITPVDSHYRELLFKLPGSDIRYLNPHWPDSVVLAHARLEDFTAADGGRVLFIDEIQSDWHQDGRKHGYVSSNETTGLRAVLRSEDVFNSAGDGLVTTEWYDIYDSKGDLIGRARGDSANAAVNKFKASKRHLPPEAPYEKTWHEFVLKNLLRLAAENRYDYVAWTTGKQQADIYKRLSDRQKAGMSAFYDVGGKASQNIPKFLNKYLKVWGGKVETVKLSTPDTEQPGVKITPAMKEAVLNQGQPRFSLDSEGRLLTAEQAAFFKDSKVRDKNGKLRPVYHYTNGQFTAFQKTEESVGSRRTLGDGYYFSTNPEEFASFGKNRMDMYANVTNPFEMQLSEKQAISVYDRYFKPFHEDKYNTYRPHVLASLQSPVKVFDYLKEASNSTSEILSGLGFDGVHDGTEWVVFNSNQLKAIDNVQPTLDDDIRYSFDSMGAQLSPAQIQYFNDTSARDPSGALERVYHGTMSDFWEFSTKDGNVEADWGAGFYFTNNEEDVWENYANPEGGDLELKIGTYIDELLSTEAVATAEEAQEMAIAKYMPRSEPRTIEAYLNLANPVIINGRESTYFDYDIGYDAETDEYGTPTGRFVEFLESVKNVLDEYEDGQAYYDAIDEVYAQFADDGIVSADDATKAVKRALADFIDYDSGKLAVNEVVRQALEDMGFDGIIDKTVAWKFGSKSGKRRAMKGVTPETTHYIAFSSNQAKETTNLTPTEAPDIRHSLDLSTEELIAKWEKAKQQYGTIEPGMQPRNEERVGDTPKQVTPDKNVSRFARTAMESENTPDDFIDPAKLAILAGKGSYIVLTDKDARAWAEAKYNREGLTKAHDSWESLMKSNKMLTKNEIVFGEILMVEAAERGDYEAWEKLLTDLCAAATIAGQTVQAFSMLKKLTGPGRVMSIIKQIQTLETEINLRRKGGKQLKIEVDPALLAKLSQAKTLAEIEAIEEQIIISVAPQIPPSMSDRVIAWRYLAMLGNARTHIRNIVSNAAMAGTRNVKDVMGGAMEDLFIEPGQERTKTNRRVSAEIKEFSTQDFDNVRDTITSGGKYGFETSLQKYRRQFDTKWVDKLSKLNLQALEAEDLWFMKRAYIQSFGKYLTANKYTLEFLKSNTKESNTALAKARQYSIQEAKKATYRDDAALASALNRIERQGGVAASIIIGGLAPFKKTPINIVKRGIEYSPVGIADTFTRQASKLHKGDITAAEFIDHLCAGMTGSALFVLGMFLGLHGWMIAGGDDDDKKNEYYQQDLGKQNYAVNILGYSVTLDWLTPSSMPLMAGVELATTVVKDDYDFDINGLLEALIKTADPVTELSLLQGVNDALTTYDANRIGGVASSAVMSYAGQFLPTMGGQVARVVDPIRRSTYAATDTSVLGGKRVEQFFRKAGNKIPGVSTKNEPYIDVWGRTQNRNESDGSGVLNFAGRVAEQMIFPGYVKERKQTAVDDEIARVFAVNNNKTVIPSKPESSFTTEGETYYLKPKELTRLQEQAGQTAYRVLEEVFKSPAYQTADQETKESMIGNVYTYAKKVAKADFLETSGNETVTPPDGLDKVEAAKDVGLNEGVYLSTMKVIGGIKGDIDPTTGKATSRDKIGLTTRKTKVRNYLAEQGFTRNQINFILAANNYSIN